MDNLEQSVGRLDSLYNMRTQYLWASKEKGIRLIGYLCSFVPTELITAAGFLPVRIIGDPLVRVDKASEYVEPNLCPYVLNCFDLIMRNKYRMLDGIVIPAACDSVERVYGALWFYYTNVHFLHFIHVPHTITTSTVNFYKEELEIFTRKMEASFGISLDDDKIWNAIRLHNENKELIKKFYELRKTSNSSISAVDMTKLLILGVNMSAYDYNVLLKDLYRIWSPVKKDEKTKSKPRILLMGCIIDNTILIELIEDSGAMVVVDDTCIGTKTYFNLSEGSDPFEALSNAYFVNFLCPRTYRTPGRAMFDYLLKLIADFEVDGVVMYYLRFCDPYGFDYPLIQDILKQNQVPILRIEDDYRPANLEALKTRIQAFCEIMAQR